MAFFAEQARKLVDQSPKPVRWLVIDATAITGLDFSAGEALTELQQDLAKKGVTLALLVILARHHRTLGRMGLTDLIGSHRIFESRQACLDAYHAESPHGISTPLVHQPAG